MNSISAAQKEAIEHKDGPMMVLAGPGSGKTFVITRRLRNMIINHNIRAENILVITFTRNSAIEMEERFLSLMEDTYAPVSFGTFHAIYFNILKETYGYDMSNILKENEKIYFMKNIIESVNEHNDKKIDDVFIPEIISYISKMKNYDIPLSEAHISILEDDLLRTIIDQYEKTLSDINKIDFDDMVVKCRELLQKDNDTLLKWRNRYKYILIDEFQDINKIQFDVVKLIAEPEYNLFVVGDDDQSIYGFRGSCPDIMLNFKNEFNNVKEVLLDTNYRCVSDIVQKSVSFINHNKVRFKKLIKANRISNKKVILKSFDYKIDEANDIIKIIKISKRKTIYSDVAIIFRTNKAARYIIKELFNNGIPYNFKEKPQSIFKSAIALDILSILSFVNGENTRTNFLRFMNKPVRYIPRNILKNETINFDELLMLSKDKKYLSNNILRLKNDLDTISKLSVYEGIIYIRRIMQYEDHIIKSSKDNNNDINEMKEILDLIQDSAKDKESFKDFLKYVEDYEEAFTKDESNSTEDAVNIITMHGSKGLEYKTVIIPDINEGYIPSPKALSDEALEEERRVFYVALTRAKDNLFLMYLRKNTENRNSKSRFINEIRGLEEFT